MIKPYGFILDDKHLKRAGMDYWPHLDVTEYENWDDFKSKNEGTFYYLTRYGKKPHTSFDYSNENENNENDKTDHQPLFPR